MKHGLAAVLARLAFAVWLMAFGMAWAGPQAREMTDAEFQATTGMEPGDLMYRQPYAVERELDAMQPRQAGKTNLYYIGFAADAEENVFTHDVELAQKRLYAYGAQGHAMVLLNNIDHVYDTPIADAANLQTALAGIAKRMDTREDVLVLFLSSHGASDASLWVHYPPLRLRDLHARQLKRMLDQSGIRYRVVVISACYSGAFIDALKDDNTLVITSSSRDHESYGCGDVTRYTEFAGDYFGGSLQNGASFIDAFDAARRRIAVDERHDQLTSSNPQIYIGRNIAEMLNRLPFAREHAASPRLAVTQSVQAQIDAIPIVCPLSGGSPLCRSGEIQAFISAAWADYGKIHPPDIYLPYYRFMIREGFPAKGRVTIQVWLDNQLLMRERKVMVMDGGAIYTYDLNQRRIVRRANFQ